MFGEYNSDLIVYIQVVGDSRVTKVKDIKKSRADEWKRVDVELKNKLNFRAVIHGEQSPGRKGEVAIDDISFTPECIPMYTIVTTPIPTVRPAGECEKNGKFSCDDNFCIPQPEVCDFKLDCKHGKDERKCPSLCTFEDGSTCGWTIITQKGDGLEVNVTMAEAATLIANNAPLVDKTTNTSSGYYLLIHSSLETETGPIDEYRSPSFSSSSSTCKFSFWYSARLSFMRPTVVLKTAEQKSVDMYQTVNTVVRKWEQAEMGLGRRKQPFTVSLVKKGAMSKWDYLALDDIEFIDCALPSPRQRNCPEFHCKKNAACVKFSRVCDLTDDCGDGTDEENCEGQRYLLTDFETGFGFFRGVKVDLSWEIRNGTVPGHMNAKVGPVFDHTHATLDGSYAYFTKGRSATYNQRAWLVSEVIKVEITDGCLMRFYYYMYGPDINKLNIYTRTKFNGNLTSVWGKQGQEGNYWQRGEVRFSEVELFEVVIEGRSGIQTSDGIAIDDLSFTPGCRYVQGLVLPTIPPVLPSTTTQLPSNCKSGQFYCIEDKVCISAEKKCDFRKDCSDGSDEDGCVKEECSFVNDLCGWSVSNKNKKNTRPKRDDHVFRWVRIRADEELTAVNNKSRPARDHTYNSTEGWYLLADGAPGRQGDLTSLVSPIISFTHARCALDFWIYCGQWSCTLNIYQDTIEDEKMKSAVVWKSAQQLYGQYTSAWNHGKVLLGAVNNFMLRLETVRPFTYLMVVSLDDIKFENCPPPLPPPPEEILCPDHQFMCASRRCIDSSLHCDFNNDCLDRSDEILCTKYNSRCDFEDGVCKSWTVEPDDNVQWTLQSGRSAIYANSPNTDHTLGTQDGMLLSVASGYGQINKKRPKLHSETINGAAVNCEVRIWYNVIKSSHKVNVYRRTSYDAQGMQLVDTLHSDVFNYWHRGEINMDGEGRDFQIVFEAELVGSTGSINIDDISLTPGCSLVNSIIPGKPTETPPTDLCRPEKFPCKNGLCYTHAQHCNFIDDCGDGTDEVDCGTGCDFENGTCGWYNPYGHVAEWSLKKGKLYWFGGPDTDHTLKTINGSYIAAGNWNNQRRGTAEFHTKPYVMSGPRCKMSLWYFLDGKHVGSLSLLLRYTSESEKSQELWNFNVSQGRLWREQIATINTQEHFAVVLRATYGSGYEMAAAVDDINFIECEPTLPPLECTASEFMCDDKKKCIKIWVTCDGKFDCDDKSDEYVTLCKETQPGDCAFDSENWLIECKWKEMEYSDFNWSRADASHSNDTGPHKSHNVQKHGYYLFINSSQQTEGQRAAVGTQLFRASVGKCHLRFWFYMKGSKKMGRLEVLTEGDQGQVNRLWSRSDPQVDDWIYGSVIVGSSHDYRVVFLGVVGGDNLTDIAIDEVSFTSGCLEGGEAVIPTGTPPPCTLEEYKCLNGSVICIPRTWRCDCHFDCEDGSDEDGCQEHCISTGAPKTLPTRPVVTTTLVTHPGTLVPQAHCNDTQVSCDDGETCIPGILLCDGVHDCPDGSDEHKCVTKWSCSEGYYFCQDKLHPPCLHRSKLCNQIYDCSDGSDESICGVCPEYYCQNQGVCTHNGKAPVCKCPLGYGENRCINRLATSPPIKEPQKLNKSGPEWIAGVVIGTILLVTIVLLIWYKRKTNVERQKIPHAIDNPAYGVNLDNFNLDGLNTYLPSTTMEATPSATAIENPLYALESDGKKE